MDFDELDESLRRLAAVQPPVDAALAEVRRRHRRTRLVRGVIAAGAVIVSVIVVVTSLVWRSSTTDSQRVDTIDSPPASALVAPTTIALSADVSRCFPSLAAYVVPAADAAVTPWPPGLPPLLALSTTGELWVVRDGRATRWTTGPFGALGGPGYLWARWASDGSIWASRLVNGTEVDLDRFTGPGQATTGVALPFTVKAGAPEGVCPIDGYLASFAMGPEGIVLAAHQAGPLPHSCPYVGTPDTDPWRCSSREGVGFERRANPTWGPGLANHFVGGGGGGGLSPAILAADAADDPAFVYVTGGSATIVWPDRQPECCGGSPAVHGNLLALSPDANQLAFSPDGTTVHVASLALSSRVSEHPIWTAPDRVEGLAWSGDTVAVVTPGRLTLVSATDGMAQPVDGWMAPEIATLDFAS